MGGDGSGRPLGVKGILERSKSTNDTAGNTFILPNYSGVQTAALRGSTAITVHARQHSITTAADHTSTATSGQMLKADANGLPVDATNTDAQVSAAVTASHGVNDTNTSAISKALLTEQGDVIYASAASTPAALAHGTAGQLLQSGGHAADPSWVTNTHVLTAGATDVTASANELNWYNHVRKTYESDFSANAIDATRWTSTVVNGTNVATSGDMVGYILSSTTAIAGRSAKMQNTMGTRAWDGATLVFDFVVYMNTAASAGSKWYIGLSTAIGSTLANNCVGLGYDNDNVADNWSFYTKDNAGVVEKDTGLAFGTVSTAYFIRFISTGTGTAWSCYVNGTQIGTTHSTNIPSTSTQMYLGWSVDNGADNTNNRLEVDNVKVTFSNPNTT